MSTAKSLSHPSDAFSFNRLIDARGLSCPLPIFNTKTSLDNLKPGEIVKVLSSDRHSPQFFESMARQTGLELLSSSKHEDDFVFYLGKSKHG